MGVSNGLEKLHDLYLKLKEVQEELDRGPRVVKAKEAMLAKRQVELEETKHRHLEQRKLADSKNLQLKTAEVKLADFRTKLNMCGTNREFDILKGQIAADEMAKSVLEDEILDCMEQSDRLKVFVVEAEKVVAATKDDIQKFTAQIAAAKVGLADKAATLRVAVKEAEAVIQAEFLPQYRRLVNSYGADALALVENGVCSNCYVTLAPQEQVNLRGGKMMFCNCGRLLYVKSSG